MVMGEKSSLSVFLGGRLAMAFGGNVCVFFVVINIFSYM